MWKCAACSAPPTGYPLERKAIDVSGRLGSLYDASTDNLIDQYSVEASRTKIPKHSISRIFSGVQSNEEIIFLKEIGFDGALRQSILLQLVTPSGVCRLIDYNRPINQNTRFLYYSYRSRIDKLNVEARKTDQIVAPPLNPTRATHMITQILWGFEILCIIQIPKNQSVNAVDQLLNRICSRLENDARPFDITNEERHLVAQLTDVTVYGSETCIHDSNIPLLTILTRIQGWQGNINFHQPLKYTMQPLRWLYNSKQFPQSCSWPYQDDPHLEQIEPVLIRIKNRIKHLQEILQNLPENFFSQGLNQHSKDIREQFGFLLDSQENLQGRLAKVLMDVRRHRVKSKIISAIISDQRYACLYRTEMDKYFTRVQRLSKKVILIEELQNDRIQYINALDVRSDTRTSITNEDVDAILKRSFSNENGRVILWYSSDRLQREQADRWEQIYQQLTSERQQTIPPIKLIYVDFSYCQQRLEGFAIVRLPSTGTSETRHDPTTEVVPRPPRTHSAPPPSRPQHGSPSPLSERLIRPSTPTTRRNRTPSPPPRSKRLRESSTSPPPPPPSKTDINVLLLGETGVGKSTFINAFVNYLKFDTLQQAERGDPVALIPVSFLITVGDQLDEFIVKFGNVDPNENHEHQGQSVTQQCKSYVFDLNDKLSLRLIDTPGIGDTRGIAQDVKNIDHILTYVNNFPHLNAVCLLLKPNASRLNVFFRSCINQLLTYLTPIGYNNIIFCFTNARSTFYAPGDTGPLLRKMLIDEHLNDIPFQKENTFCFDSESFRYLAARKCDIDFDDYQKEEYINSWNTSVTESIRLLDFIQTRESYNLEEWVSPRRAALDISMFARPLMETLRLIIYNWKLSEAKLIGNRLELNSNPVAIEMCTHCAQINIVEIGPFWLTQYQPVPLKSNANQHRLCPLDDKDFLIETIVQHEFVAEGAGIKNEKWQSSFRNFLFKCDRLLHFLRQQGPSAQDDPFGPILERFLEEEQQISQIRNINSNMNRRVRQALNSVKQIRQQNSQQLFQSNERLSLREVYQILDELKAMQTVKKQIDSIKRSRQLKMKANEYRIPTNLIQNRTFT